MSVFSLICMVNMCPVVEHDKLAVQSQTKWLSSWVIVQTIYLLNVKLFLLTVQLNCQAGTWTKNGSHLACIWQPRKVLARDIVACIMSVCTAVHCLLIMIAFGVFRCSQWTHKFRHVMLRLATTLDLRTWWCGVIRTQSALCPTFCCSFSGPSSTSRVAHTCMIRWDIVLLLSCCIMFSFSHFLISRIFVFAYHDSIFSFVLVVLNWYECLRASIKGEMRFLSQESGGE